MEHLASALPATEVEQPATEPEVSAPPQDLTQLVEILVPVFAGEWNGFSGSRRVDLKMTREMARKLRRIQLGLEQQDAKLRSGRIVSTPSHALIWLIENVVG